MSEWYYAIDRRQMGPVTEPELRELASAGALRPSDLVWKEGAPEWVKAGDCAEIFPDPARVRFAEDFDRPRNFGYDDDYGRPRRFDDDGLRRRPMNKSGSGRIVSLCVVGALLAFIVVGVILYFVVANGSGRPVRAFIQGNQRIWEDRLTMFDAQDPTKQGCYCKIYPVQMTAGTSYQIDLESDHFDSWLRLEDPAGVQVAFDDDGGPIHPDSRIIYTASKTGMHNIYVTTCYTGEQGDYTLKISPP